MGYSGIRHDSNLPPQSVGDFVIALDERDLPRKDVNFARWQSRDPP